MRKVYVLIIVVCYVIFFVAIPPFQLPDEPDHFQYVYWLSKGVYPKLPQKGGLKLYDPTIQQVYDMLEVASNDYNISNFSKIQKASRSHTPFTTQKNSWGLTYQAHHPPLYHLTALLFFVPSYIFSRGDLISTYYITKLISALYFALSIYFAWKIGTLLFKNKNIVQYATLVYALNPVTLKMGITINPDIASVAVTSSILYVFLMRLRNKSFSNQEIIGISVLLATAALIKFQNISYLFFCSTFFFLRVLVTKQVKQNIKHGFFIIMCTLLFISPWLLFSLFTYHAITPSYVAYQYFCTANLPLIPFWKVPLEVLYEFRHAFFHFAGFLGWGEPYPFKPFFISYAAVFFMLFIYGLYVIYKKRKLEWPLVLFHACSICLFFLGVSITYKINRYSCDVQGRYLLSALFPFILMIFYGVKKEWIVKVIFFFTLWQYIFILWHVLIPRYYV